MSERSDSTVKHRKLAIQGGLLIAAAALAFAFPQVFTNPATTNYGVMAMIFVTVASAWNIFSGYSGYISIGQAVFFGSGAYAMGAAAEGWNITGTTTFALLPLAGAVGALIAVPFGLIALRVRRHTFIVITIAFFFIFQWQKSSYTQVLPLGAGSVPIIASKPAWTS